MRKWFNLNSNDVQLNSNLPATVALDVFAVAVVAAVVAN